MLVMSAAFMVWMERKVCAYIQDRIGPNRVGFEGGLQPFADVLKLLIKEELRPKAADALLFIIAPIISAAAAFAAFSVVPFGTETTLFGLLDEPIPLQVTDVNVAVLVVFAITSMGVYGIVLAGWSSNSKYSLLGGAALVGADDQLRAVVRAGAGGGDHDGRVALAARDRPRPGRHVVRLHPEVVRLPAAARLLDLHVRGRRGDQPRAVRLSRSGAGARRRLPHRVQLDELRDVLPRRIREHGHRLGGGDQPVSRRLARSVPARLARGGSGSSSRCS